MNTVLELLKNVNPGKNIKLIEGEDSDMVDMFGISMQMLDEDLEGEDIIFCSQGTFEAFLD